MRRCIGRLCSSAAAAAAASPSSKPQTDHIVQKTADVFAMRRAPTSLHTENMHSNSLSEHPVTHRVAQNEVLFKQRKLAERGEFEKAAAAELEAAARHEEGRGGSEAGEYRNVVIFMVLGYLSAHSVVYKYYYPEDVRFSYQPDRGYTDDVEKRREVLQSVDELVGFNVLEHVFEKRRANFKIPIETQNKQAH